MCSAQTTSEMFLKQDICQIGITAELPSPGVDMDHN